MRLKEISEVIWEDQKTKLQWTKTFQRMALDEAVVFCENLNYGGHSDWRLPSIEELISLVDYSKWGPASSIPVTEPSYYWSATTYANNTGYAWHVFFDAGYVSNYYRKSSALYVRAVRGGQC